ncbi:hypothetical protein MaudCBS49596_005266 [Microsporum audouinii]
MDYGLTEEESERLKYAKKWLRQALKMSNGELYNTEVYWNYVQMKLDYQQEVYTLLLKRANAAYPNDGSHREYPSNIEEVARRQQSVQRKQDRQRARNIVRSFSKAGDLPMVRVAYAELLTLLKTRMFCFNERNFLSNLKRAYGTIKNEDIQYYWDVFHNTLITHEVFSAARIFPLSYGQSTMTYIFGLDAIGEINSARNGLLVQRPFASRFDAHKFSIVPQDPNSSDPQEWKAVSIGEPRPYDEFFCEKKLIFLTEERPSARYLYFHYIVSLISHYQERKRDDIAAPPDPYIPRLSTVWGTGKGYLRESVVLGLVEELGDILPDEMKADMLDHCFKPSEANHDNEIAEISRSVEEMDLGSDDEEYEMEIAPEYYPENSEDDYIYTAYNSDVETEDGDE